MNNELFKKVDYYWYCFILTLILSFGFYLTHSAMGIDDEIMPEFLSGYSVFVSGRIGRVFSGILQINEYLPFWKEFLSVVLYAIGITLHSQNLVKFLKFENFEFDKKMATICSCVLASFPYMAFLMSFMLVCFDNGCNMILSAFAVNYFYKSSANRKKYFLIVFLLISLIISMYEVCFLYFFVSVVFIELINLIFNSKYSTKQAYINISNAILISIMSIFCIRTIVNIVRKCRGIVDTRFEEFSKYDFSSVKNFLISSYEMVKEFLDSFLKTCEYDFGSIISVICIVLLTIICIFYSFKRKNINILLLGILMMLIPFSVLFITGNPESHYRIYIPLAFLNAYTIAILYVILKGNSLLSRILIILSIYVVFSQSKEMNQIFYTEYLKFQNDRMFAYSLSQDIKKIDADKPVLLIGIRQNLNLKHEYYIEAPEVNISIFNWDRYGDRFHEVFVGRPYAFIYEQGFNINNFRNELRSKGKNELMEYFSQIDKQAKEMTIYPQEGSIINNDDYILIKIGESEFDK